MEWVSGSQILRLQLSGCRLQSRRVSGEPEKLKVFTLAQDLELIAALDQETCSLEPAALDCGRSPRCASVF